MDPESDDETLGSDAGDEPGQNSDWRPGKPVTYKDRLDTAIKEIKAKKTFSGEDVTQFLSVHGQVVNESDPNINDGNFLHALVDVVKHTEYLKPQDIELLLREAVDRWPERLLDLNREQYTPIIMAMRNRQSRLVTYMVSACIGKECFEKVMAKKGSLGDNCVHYAFRNDVDLDFQTRKLLVENASDKVLAEPNDERKTPAHYAVAHNRCVRLIPLFLSRDLMQWNAQDRTGKTFLDLLDVSGTSVYREYERASALYATEITGSRQTVDEGDVQQSQLVSVAARSGVWAARDQGASGDPDRLRNANKDRRRGDTGNGPDNRERERNERKAEEAKRKAEATKHQRAVESRCSDDDDILRTRERGARDCNMLSRTDGSSEKAAGPVVPSQHAGPDDHDVPIMSFKRRSTPHVNLDPEPPRSNETESTNWQAAHDTPSTGAQGPGARLQRWYENGQMMKLQYMRTREAEDVISFLYGNNTDSKCYRHNFRHATTYFRSVAYEY